MGASAAPRRVVSVASSDDLRSGKAIPSLPGLRDLEDLLAPIPKPPFADPDDFVAPAGQLIPVNRASPPSPADVYRCAGCVRHECYGPTGCVSFEWRHQAGGYLREILTSKVYAVAKETPCELAVGITEGDGCAEGTGFGARGLGNRLYLKREDLQPVRSFKLRGAYNRMSRMSPEELARGVICSSAGNHAQGVALAARSLGCSAAICMPINAPEIKVAAAKKLGASVELVGESFLEAAARAVERSLEEGRTFVNAYDDPLCIAGQGTAGYEILRQIDMDAIDYVFVAVGGGGLIAGIAAVIKALKPSIKVIGVEPTGANAMTQSLVRGERVTLSRVDAFADGVAIKLPGAEAFRLCRELLDGMVVVDNSAISAAVKDVFEETRSILEPSGALSVAGALAFATRNGIRGKTFVAVTSGANMNFDRLRLVSELANVGSDETMLAIRQKDATGGLLGIVRALKREGEGESEAAGADARAGRDGAAASAALGGGAGGSAGGRPEVDTDFVDITEFKYRMAPHGHDARMLCGVALPPRSRELRALCDKLRRHDRVVAVRDISDAEMAQTHLRHMIAGIAGHTIEHERIFQVTYPEHPGMLARLFAPFVSWPVTLVHFRKSGNRSATLVLGLAVPERDSQAFKAAVDQLAGEAFIIEPLSGRAKEAFDLFMS